jgi:hypothetical protein
MNEDNIKNQADAAPSATPLVHKRRIRLTLYQLTNEPAKDGPPH